MYFKKLEMLKFCLVVVYIVQSAPDDSNPPQLDITLTRTKIDHDFPLMSVIYLMQFYP